MSKVILITGTSSGFGKSIAEKLHSLGYTVIGTSRNADKINSALYFEIALPKMIKGALLIADNVLWDGKVLGKENGKGSITKALKEFNVKLKNDDRVQTVMLPLRDGITLSWVC